MIRAASTRWSRISAIGIATLLVTLAVAGPWLTPNTPSEQIAESVYAPPMLPHIMDVGGHLRFPFVYPLRLTDRLTHSYSEDRAQPMRLRFFSQGAFVSVDSGYGHAWFPLGSDALGRDQLARLAVGARLSLGVALAAAAGALLIGAIVGALAGFFGGVLDDGLMRLADVIVALPALYVVLALRAAMPLVLTGPQVFWTLVLVLALVGWPFPARGVRAVVAAERVRDTPESARALGASRSAFCYGISCRLPGVSSSCRRRCWYRVHPRRSDSFLCRTGLRRPDLELGCDATRGGLRPRPRRSSVAASACHRDRACGACGEPWLGVRKLDRLNCSADSSN